MTTIPTLLMLGNRFFVALLKEAQLACTDGDGERMRERLEEFKTHIERHRKAESEILYPKLSALDLALDNELLELREDYSQIALLVDTALENLKGTDKINIVLLLDQLVDLTSGHWMSQEHLVYSLAQQADEHLLYALASELMPEESPDLDGAQHIAPTETAKHLPH